MTVDAITAYKWRRDMRLDSKRIDTISSYRKRRAARLDDDLEDWITMENGVHVPVAEGETHKEAAESFIE